MTEMVRGAVRRPTLYCMVKRPFNSDIGYDIVSIAALISLQGTFQEASFDGGGSRSPSDQVTSLKELEGYIGRNITTDPSNEDNLSSPWQ
jgi:hypothetical protein